MDKITQIDSPLNAQEKYLYGINLRLEVLIDQVSSLVEHIAKTQEVPIENSVVEDVKEVVQNVSPVATKRKRG